MDEEVCFLYGIYARIQWWAALLRIKRRWRLRILLRNAEALALPLFRKKGSLVLAFFQCFLCVY